MWKLYKVVLVTTFVVYLLLSVLAIVELCYVLSLIQAEYAKALEVMCNAGY